MQEDPLTKNPNPSTPPPSSLRFRPPRINSPPIILPHIRLQAPPHRILHPQTLSLTRPLRLGGFFIALRSCQLIRPINNVFNVVVPVYIVFDDQRARDVIVNNVLLDIGMCAQYTQ
ncbi:hypothetical protein M011DRAFT_202112 [Sporormia fimetaria CBS 119925]|uniref:Uncharacterized protein n=1 Tax=Sporormia fimetaria CBS 119925 TaxID=1340428 RepID=A0A6A6V0F1_9PLEO|nr:hypothetical protein M011DRAFT_202112 [Sporormia fimetaria CBS 119925]